MADWMTTSCHRSYAVGGLLQPTQTQAKTTKQMLLTFNITSSEENYASTGTLADMVLMSSLSRLGISF